jgi:hypothetical protein
VTKEVLALALTVLVHIVGLAALVWALLADEEDRPDWRRWLRLDDDPGPSPSGPEPAGGGLPRLDAEPSAVRLREPGRLADGYPQPARRPQHDPPRVPHRVPAAPARDDA